MSLVRTVLLALAALCAATGAHAQIAYRAASQAATASSAAPVFVASATNTTNSSSMAINLPAGAAQNDILIAQLTIKGVQTVTEPAPAGSWTLIDVTSSGTSGNEITQAVYWRRVGAIGSEPASYTWSWSSSDRVSGGIAAYRNVEEVLDPIDASGVRANNASSTITLPTITTTTPNTMLVALLGSSRAANNHGVPTGMTTERYELDSSAGPNGVTSSLDEQVQATAGSSGAKSATSSNSVDNIAHLLALRARGALTLPVPTGTVANDVMIASIAVRPCSAVSGAACTVTIGAPAGWTLVNTVNQTTGGAFGDRLVVYWRVATAGDVGASYTWTFAGAPAHTGAVGGIVGFSGVDTTTPIVAQAGQATASASAHVAPSIDTGAVTNTMLVSTHGINASGTWTAQAGMTERVDIASLAVTNNAGISLEMNMEARAAAGVTGTRTGTLSNPPAANTGATHMLALRPAVSINHFAIAHAGSGVACVDQAITITAHDASHSPVSANALLVNLSTTNGKGTWTAILAGGGTLNDATPGDGAATYQFAVGSNSVQLAFRYANLAATSEIFGFNVSGGGFSETTGTASGTDDPSFTMSQAGFQFRNVTDANTTIPVQISGKASNTGFNSKTLRIQAIRTDTVTGSCTGLFASQTRSVDLGAECNSPATCAARQVSVNGTNIATSNNNGGAGASAYTGVSLTFNASSEADTVIAYPDAGQISLHARYDLDPLVAGFEMIGSSNTFVVRPFGLAFPGINHGSTAAGTLIGAAGDNFPMTVRAYQWAAGEDANNDGIPDAAVNITDNGTVPNFAATATVGRSANLPGVALGAVARGVACAGAATIALSGGTATAADWCYSEVGNVILTADVTNYISAGVNITGNSGLDGVAGGGYVGRFRPKSFVVTGTPTLANRVLLACASSFTYMNEGLSLGFTLEARNTQNTLTQNYTGAYARLDLSAAANLGIGARSGATNLTPRVDNGVAPAGSFTNGVANITATTGITRAVPDNPDGPHTATQFGIAPNDADGVLMQSYNQDVDGVGGNDHFAVAPTTELRFGRLRLANGYGPDTASVQLPLDLQYWNGTGFTLNTQDSCTSLARANIALSFTGVIAACDTAVLEPTLAFTSGASLLTLAAPGAAKTGTVTLAPQLGTAAGTYCPAKGAGTAAATVSTTAYLLGRWDDAANPDGNANTAYDDKPAASAGFGLYGSRPKSFIFFRENY